MQDLYCKSCVAAAPLYAPYLMSGSWRAVCGECLTINCLAPVNENVFLPLRLRVVGVLGEVRPLGAKLAMPADAC
jgi:hypothetical protein